MKNPLISIVMPAKNTALFLAECLDSILLQSATNWELLVVDDNSTDTTFSILENYAQKDNRVQIFKNKGSGIIDALRISVLAILVNINLKI